MGKAEKLQDVNNCIRLKEYQGAQKILMEMIDGGDGGADVYFILANIFHQEGKMGKAIKCFKKVLMLEPNHTDASISLSVLYNDIGSYDEAKRIFEQADDRVKKKGNTDLITDEHINKKFALKHLELADMYFTYQRYDEALFEYKKAIALDPKNLDSRIKISKVYSKKGFVGRAFDELRKLKVENPEFLKARNSLGVLYYSKGSILEAQKEWRVVLSKDPLNQEASKYLKLSSTATEISLEGH